MLSRHADSPLRAIFSPPIDVLRRCLEPGDILLIEGNTRLSAVIKFLTQSTWSHAALYIGESAKEGKTEGEQNALLEANAEHGVLLAPLSKYAHFNTRICRPVGLDSNERQKVIDYALARVGTQYDTKQILDLARYLFPYPPVPVFLRRRLLAIGSGDPTRAICSTLIAQAFESIHYPILPESADAGPIDSKARRLVKLALAIGVLSEGAVHSHVRRALNEGISKEEIKQVALLAIPTLGFPQGVRVLTWIEDITDEAHQ